MLAKENLFPNPDIIHLLEEAARNPAVRQEQVKLLCVYVVTKS